MKSEIQLQKNQFWNKRGQLCTKREDGTIRVQTIPSGETKTQQHMAPACDINNLMARYTKKQANRLLNSLPDPQGTYADLSQMGDYQDSLNKIAKANAAFEILPSDFRSELKNDPQNLIHWLAKPENRQRAEKMGLMKPKPVVQKQNETIQKNDKSDDKITDNKPNT